MGMYYMFILKSDIQKVFVKPTIEHWMAGWSS